MRLGGYGEGYHSWELNLRKEKEKKRKWQYEEEEKKDKTALQNELTNKLFCLCYTKQFYNLRHCTE